MSTDQVVGKIAEAISVHIEDDIEISHRIRPAEARREVTSKVDEAHTNLICLFQVFSVIALWKRWNALSVSSAMKT